MATRAFLLCGDEKAVQAVTQILDELEVSFEHSSEPAFSLKRLATQRFELLIVDCDNPQNATQVFNSARASTLNKTSIAIAIVEGKAGVPNAFRLGASLVLTKPVSLEQARNTLRTGIGMTRKEVQEVKAPCAASNPPASTIVPPAPLPISAAAVTPTQAAPVRIPATPAVLTPVAPPVPPAAKPFTEAPKPTISSTAADKAQAPRPSVVPSIPQEHKPALSNFSEEKNTPTPVTPPLARATAAPTGSSTSASSKNFDSVFKLPTAADAKTSNLSKGADAGGKKVDGPALSIVDPLAEEDALDPIRDHGVPSFGALGKVGFAGMGEAKSKGGKGLLIAAVILLLVGAGGYGAWLTQPEFRKLVSWEYLMSKSAAPRGESQVAAKPTVPAPIPAAAIAPDPAPAQTATTANADSAAAPSDDISTAGPNSTMPAANPTSSNEPAAPKSAAIQPAKQDATAAHPANPALVAASLPATPAAKAPSSELLEVPEDFADDQIVHRVHATYPKQARARKLHGTVVLEAIVNKKGAVDSLQLVSGDPLLAQAAADAVKQWRYKPYLHNNEPTEFQTRITIDFKTP